MSDEDWRLAPFLLLLVLTGVPESKQDRPMMYQLTRYAALTTVRGALLVGFGLVCLATRDPSPAFMLGTFAMFSVADGLAAMIVGYGASLPQPIVSGALSCMLGVTAMSIDHASAGVLTMILMTATIVRGLSDLSMSQLFKYAIARDQGLRVEAVVSLLFAGALGVAMVIDSVSPALMITYAVLAGGCLLVQSVSTCWVIAAVEPRTVIRTVAPRAPRSV